MKILLIGSGGREHALAWKLAQSPHCKKLIIAPGNLGTAQHGENAAVDPLDFKGIAGLALEKKTDLVVVGPEAPLAEGIHDYFLAGKNVCHIPVIGPVKAGAMLEGSKDFAKRFMVKHGIPTARHRSFSAENIGEGISYLDSCSPPVVLKASGLAAGKGVLICQGTEEAKTSLREMISGGKFGKAGATVIVEEFLQGVEFSVFILTDGKSWKLLPVAKDYKRIGEGDTGLNTGGMGAVSPVSFADDVMMMKVRNRIIEPTLAGLKKDRIPYSGFLYFGLMNIAGDPYVIEYNVRLGDPEAEAVIPLISGDFVELLESVAKRELSGRELTLARQAAATTVLASGGYPGNFGKGEDISGVEKVNSALVFHSGTAMQGEKLVTAGGRVFAVTALGNTLAEAVASSQAAAETIQFRGKYFRRDIGRDVLSENRKM